MLSEEAYLNGNRTSGYMEKSMPIFPLNPKKDINLVIPDTINIMVF